MNYRRAQLLAPTDLGPSGTKDIALDIDQPISKIEIRFQTTKASQGMSVGSPGNIEKIEIVDGSGALYSLTGFENQALNYYNVPGISMDHGQHISTLSEVDTYVIMFGRWLWDELLAFQPSRFRNPQLRITFNEDLSDTSVTVNEMEIWAFIFDEKQISPIGYLTAREWFDYTVGSDNSFETIVLPEDLDIRQMFVRAFRQSVAPWGQIDEIRFDENNLERIPFEYTNLEQYYRTMKSVWPMIQTQLSLISDTGGLIFYIPQTDFYAGASFMGLGGTTEVYHTNASSEGGELAITGSGNINALGVAFGYLPWHTFQFPMGLKDDIDDWYKPQGKHPRVRLRAAGSGTNGTGQLVLEQLKRY